jgi:AcrR family transcriptional regulator
LAITAPTLVAAADLQEVADRRGGDEVDLSVRFWTVGARQRILDTAYDLFSRNGVRAVGIDRIVAQSGVAKMSLYRHFPSKDVLVLSFLEERERRWTNDWLGAEVERRGGSAAQRMLAIFDVFGEWFSSSDFEGCSFINVMLEHGDRESRVRLASADHLRNIRAFVSGLAAAAGARDPEGLAHKWHILMKGSIVAAGEGDLNAAVRAQDMGRLVLADAGIVAA